jgi:hypothetical protein
MTWCRHIRDCYQRSKGLNRCHSLTREPVRLAIKLDAYGFESETPSRLLRAYTRWAKYMLAPG